MTRGPRELTKIGVTRELAGARRDWALFLHLPEKNGAAGRSRTDNGEIPSGF